MPETYSASQRSRKLHCDLWHEGVPEGHTFTVQHRSLSSYFTESRKVVPSLSEERQPAVCFPLQYMIPGTSFTLAQPTECGHGELPDWAFRTPVEVLNSRWRSENRYSAPASSKMISVKLQLHLQCTFPDRTFDDNIKFETVNVALHSLTICYRQIYHSQWCSHRFYFIFIPASTLYC